MDTNRAELTEASASRARRRSQPTPGQRLQIDRAATVALLLVFLLVVAPAFGTGQSADLLAVWNAGLALASGMPSEVYPPTTSPFTMMPPASWLERMHADGLSDEVYPFLYPPLWAWAMSKLTGFASFETVASVARVVNAMLLPATVLLAHRIAAPAMARWLFLLLGMIVVMLPPVGVVAMFQNQPQILVSFLTVLALERAMRGHERTAGLALAVAAAIKVYPVLLAVLWLARGRFRAVGTFALAGAALGIASVAAAGWPLHATFLELISVISHSVLVTQLSYTIDAGLAQIAMPELLTFIQAPDDPGIEGQAFGWFVMAEPRAMSLAGQIAQVGALALFARMLMRRPGDAAEAAIWPLAMMVLALLGPVSWGYHYIAPLAFAPMIFDRLGARPAIGLLLAGALLLSAGSRLAGDLPWPVVPRQVVGLAGLLCIAAAFALVRRRSSRSAALSSGSS